jgi:hypothetical protein
MDSLSRDAFACKTGHQPTFRGMVHLCETHHQSGGLRHHLCRSNDCPPGLRLHLVGGDGGLAHEHARVQLLVQLQDVG